jgi:hypothetical protein
MVQGKQDLPHHYPRAEKTANGELRGDVVAHIQGGVLRELRMEGSKAEYDWD